MYNFYVWDRSIDCMLMHTYGWVLSWPHICLWKGFETYSRGWLYWLSHIFSKVVHGIDVDYSIVCCSDFYATIMSPGVVNLFLCFNCRAAKLSLLRDLQSASLTYTGNLEINSGTSCWFTSSFSGMESGSASVEGSGAGELGVVTREPGRRPACCSGVGSEEARATVGTLDGFFIKKTIKYCMICSEMKCFGAYSQWVITVVSGSVPWALLTPSLTYLI